MTIIETVKEKLLTVYFPVDEKAVLTHILNSPIKASQRHIARSVEVGCHRQYESDIIPKERHFESTLRKVRQCVRNLRVTFGIPILSDREGYWIPTDESDCQEFLVRMEREARARAVSSMETYHAMNKAVGIKSKYFDSQTEFFKDVA